MARRKKARKITRSFDTEAFVNGVMERKQTKRERELEEARQQGYTDGFGVARSQYEAKASSDAAKFEAQRKALHLEVLKTMRDAYSAFGQMMQVLGRAMESEKNQL